MYLLVQKETRKKKKEGGRKQTEYGIYIKAIKTLSVTWQFYIRFSYEEEKVNTHF